MSSPSDAELLREQYRAAMLAYRAAVLRVAKSYGTPDFEEANRAAENAKAEFERLRKLTEE